MQLVKAAEGVEGCPAAGRESAHARETMLIPLPSSAPVQNEAKMRISTRFPSPPSLGSSFLM